MLNAKDIMTSDVLTVSPDMPIDELGRFFIERDISGAPVVGKEGELLGIVTEHDLISQNKKFHIPSVLRLFDAIIPIESNKAIEKEIKKMSASTAMDIATTEVLTISEDTPLDEIATIMSEKHITLLPVIKDAAIVGVVGKHEVIRGVAVEGSKQDS